MDNKIGQINYKYATIKEVWEDMNKQRNVCEGHKVRVCTYIWLIWLDRNNKIFNNKYCSVLTATTKIHYFFILFLIGIELPANVIERISRARMEARRCLVLYDGGEDGACSQGKP